MSSAARGVEKRRKGVPATSSVPAEPKNGSSAVPRANEIGRNLQHGLISYKWRTLVLALTDIFLACGSGMLAYKLRFSLTPYMALEVVKHSFRGTSEIARTYLGFLLLYVALLVLVALSQKLYRVAPGFSPLMQSLCIGRAVIVATVILTGFIYLSGIKTISRIVVGLTALFSLLTLYMWRWFQGYLERRRLAKGIGLRHAMIIGAGPVGARLADYLGNNPKLGYEFRGFLDSNHQKDIKVLGKIADLAQIARKEFIDEIFITPPSERELVKKVSVVAMQAGIDVKVVPEFYDGLAWLCPLEFVGDVPVRVLHREPIPAFWLFLKRATDIVGSTFGLIVFSPVFALIALAIKVDSRGPVLYAAVRVGKKGRRFACYKFRTMIPNADELKNQLRHRNEREGPFFKVPNDPRKTRIGHYLRKYSLDELPQLWNVLKGDMSLVGPRPHPVDDFMSYSLEHFRRLDVTPGITCLWQLNARHDPSFEKVLALDTQYIEKWNYLLDLQILLKTIPVVMRGTGQ